MKNDDALITPEIAQDHYAVFARLLHELSNPLACISTNLEFLSAVFGADDELGCTASQPPVIKEVEPALRDALEAAERMAAVLSALRVDLGRGLAEVHRSGVATLPDAPRDSRSRSR